MFREALQFLLDALLQPFAALLLFRFHAVWLRAPMRNPLGEFVMIMTNFIVLRTRRYVPTTWGHDSASLLLALLIETIYVAASIWTQGRLVADLSLVGLLAWAAVKLLKLSVHILIFTTLAQAVLSWLGKPTTVDALLAAITHPFLTPLRRRLPLFGSIDASPMVLFIICQLILIVPLGVLERLARQLLA